MGGASDIASVGTVIVLALFAVAFGVAGCLSTFAPRATADFLVRHNIRLRIGGFVETTPRNVRTVGIVFLGLVIVLVVLVIVVGTTPGLHLPFARSSLGMT